MKKLHKSKINKMMGGVIGGLGEYTGIDPTVIRLLWVFLVLVTGVVPGVILYLIASVIIPEKGE